MTALFVLFALEILVLILALFINKNDFLSPSVIVSMVLTFTIGLAVSYYQNWYTIKNFSWLACAIIVTGTLIFVLFDFIAIHTTTHKKRNIYFNKGRERLDINNKRIIIICLIDFLVLFLFYRYNASIVKQYNAMATYGASTASAAFRALYGHDTVVSAEDQMSSIMRYSLYFLQATAYVFILPFVYNVFIVKKGLVKNLKYLIPPCIYITYGFLCGSRIDVIKIAISGFFIFYILFLKNGGWSDRNVRKIAIKGFKIAGVLFVSFFFLSVLIGRSALDGSIVGSFFAHLAGYAGAPIVLFSQFVLDPISSSVAGEECFTNLFSFLNRFGLSDLVRTGHLEYRRLTAGITGNVYTFFRSPIADFGIVGMYIFTIAVALFFSTYYCKRVKYANYKNKDKFEKNLIIYSMLFQWIAFTSINQMSSEFVSIAYIIKFILVVIVYDFCYCLDIKRLILKR